MLGRMNALAFDKGSAGAGLAAAGDGQDCPDDLRHGGTGTDRASGVAAHGGKIY